MTQDFDFDGSFNEDIDEEGALDEGFEETEEEAPKKSSPLRIILLVLLILVLLCAGCAFVVQSGLIPLPFSIPGLGPAPAPTAAPAVDTPTSAPTDAGALPAATEEPALDTATEDEQAPAPETTEALPATEEPGEQEEAVPTADAGTETAATAAPDESVPTTEEPVPATEQPGDQPAASPTVETEPTEEVISEHDAEPSPTSATTPVPGPTATPGPTVAVTVTSCDNNVPPVADANGPYSAMRGKGQAVVEFDGSDSTDSDGTITAYEWEFGDGSSPETGATVSHGYNNTGSYVVTLTVTDNCGATGQDTADVTISGPTPPASGTPTTATPAPTATATPVPPTPAAGTMGYCYRVKVGDTLSGLAWQFGVPWPDLARVNHVPMYYRVIAGQGLFIPTEQITEGPNLYEVESDDTLRNIAFECGLTATTLARANNLQNDATLSPGQILVIPPWRY